MKNEYRCTREDCYGADVPKESRQGHYIVGENVEEVYLTLRKTFPRDYNFTIDLWKENVG